MAAHTNSMQPFTKQIKSGAHLFHENDHSRELYIIQSGTIKVYRQIGSKEVELARLEKGAVLGEMALIDGKSRSASAKAITDCAVIIVDADAFESKIKGVHPWFLTIIKMISSKIRKADRNLQNVHSGNRSISIILALEYLIKRYGKGSDSTCELELATTKRQLIQLLGMTHRTILMALDFLNDKKIIELREQTFVVADTALFTRYCIFLRLQVKKIFDKIVALNADQAALVQAVALARPEIFTSEAKSSDLLGEELWSIVSLAGITTLTMALLQECKAAGLIYFNKKEGPEKPDNPIAGILFSIDNAQWKKHALFNSFATLIPPV